MVKDAEANAEDDRKRKEEIEDRNRADQVVYGAERMLQDAGDKLSASDEQPVQSAIDDLKQALEKNDAGAIKSGMDRLQQAQDKVAEVLYRTTQSARARPGHPGRDAGQRRLHAAAR